jgi:hypothetical protein
MMFIAPAGGDHGKRPTRAVWRPFLALVPPDRVRVWPDMVLFLPNLVMGR